MPWETGDTGRVRPKADSGSNPTLAPTNRASQETQVGSVQKLVAEPKLPRFLPSQETEIRWL